MVTGRPRQRAQRLVCTVSADAALVLQTMLGMVTAVRLALVSRQILQGLMPVGVPRTVSVLKISTGTVLPARSALANRRTLPTRQRMVLRCTVGVVWTRHGTVRAVSRALGVLETHSVLLQTVPQFRARYASMTTVGMELAACLATTIISVPTFRPAAAPTVVLPAACKTSSGMARDVKHVLRACLILVALDRLATQSRALNVRATTLGMARVVCSAQQTQ